MTDTDELRTKFDVVFRHLNEQNDAEGVSLLREALGALSRKNKVHGPILRWRHKVVNGESHETSVFRNKKYEELLSSVFLQSPGAYGHCLAQVLVDPKGRLHLIEINPRLGGASPLALRAGLQSIAWHLMEDFGHAEKIPNMPSFVEGMSLSKKGLDVTITN